MSLPARALGVGEKVFSPSYSSAILVPPPRQHQFYFGIASLDLNPGTTTSWLCDVGQVTEHLWAVYAT